MAPLINKDTVTTDNNDPIYQQVSSMSDDQRNKLKALAQQQILNSRQKMAMSPGVGTNLQDVANIFLQQGGIKPIEPKSGGLNDIIMKAMLEDYVKSQTPEGKLARQKAQFELNQQNNTQPDAASPVATPSVASSVSASPAETTPSTVTPLTVTTATEKAPSQFIRKPSEKYPGYEVVENPDFKLWQENKKGSMTEQRKSELKSQEEAATSTVDWNKFAGAAQGLSQAYADMLGQGAGGNRANLTVGRVKSWLGGSVGEDASNLRRVDAAHRDLVLMMAPILGKSGRILNSVLKMLGETYPSGVESAYTAKSMIQQDVLNMFRIAKSANSISPDMFKNLSPDEADGMASKILSMANSYKLAPEEEKAVMSKMSDITKPLDQYISPEKRNQTILNNRNIPTTAVTETPPSTSLPKIGDTYMGGKVLKVTRIK